MATDEEFFASLQPGPPPLAEQPQDDQAFFESLEPAAQDQPVDLIEQGRGFVAGAQEENENIGAGFLDLVLNAAKFLPSSQIANLGEQGQIALRALREQSAREFAEETEGVEGAATAGRITSAIGSGALVPQAGVTGGLVSGLGRGALQGAALNQIPYVGEGEDRYTRAATGALGGAVGTGIGRGIDRLAARRAAGRGPVDRRADLIARGADETQADRAARMEEAGFTGEARPMRGQITREQEQQRLENTLAATEPGRAIRDRLNLQQQTARDQLTRAERELGTGEEAVRPIIRAKRTQEVLQQAEKISRKAVQKVWREAEENAPNLLMKPTRLTEVIDEIFDEGGDQAVTVVRRQLERHGTKRGRKIDEKGKKSGGKTFLTPKAARVVEEKLSQGARQAYRSGDAKTGMFFSRLQDAVNDDMSSVGGNAFKGAKEASRKHFERFRDLKNVNKFIRGDMAADEVVPGLMGRWKADDAAGFVRTVKRETENGLEELRGGVMNALAQGSRQGTALDEAGRPVLSPANMRKTWDKIPTEVKEEMFSKAQVKELDNFVGSFHELFSSVPGTVNVSQSTNAMLDWLHRAAGRNAFSWPRRVAGKLIEMVKKAEVANREQDQIAGALNPFAEVPRGTRPTTEAGRRVGAAVRTGVTEELER